MLEVFLTRITGGLPYRSIIPQVLSCPGARVPGLAWGYELEGVGQLEDAWSFGIECINLRNKLNHSLGRVLNQHITY